METAQKYACRSGFKMETFSDIRDVNNSNSDIVVCAYEHAPAVSHYTKFTRSSSIVIFVHYILQSVSLLQNLARDRRLAGILLNECHVLDDKLDADYRDFDGMRQLMGMLARRAAPIKSTQPFTF